LSGCSFEAGERAGESGFQTDSDGAGLERGRPESCFANFERLSALLLILPLLIRFPAE